ncbi:Antirestriction protein [Serratia fonticola]|uniref:antirestriction protein n=1 Tax=Serratia fonticola TaxID=47917 RepID=UPI00218311D8|nr:antirestriction protein [Serratia fonticola]CAI2065283.1 Antirestriction protein [Serratia fonticola]
MNTPIDTDVRHITATAVNDHQRHDFWFRYFGTIPRWMLIEPQVFGWLDRFCTDYQGGFWDFRTLNNGGAYLIPSTDQEYVLFNPLNGNGATVSQEAAGITACLMAYSHHACRNESEAMTEHFYRLREYAVYHPESRAIFSLID